MWAAVDLPGMPDMWWISKLTWRGVFRSLPAPIAAARRGLAELWIE